MISPSSPLAASIPRMELKLFGGLRLDSPEGIPLGRAGQPRRLAVLAVLALARDRSLRRDRIVALLWPDRTEDAARRQLSSAVYDLRALLGEGALEATGDLLTLRLESLILDTVRFDAAVRSRRWSDALALYTGDLLEGVDLEGSAELEQLIDDRRERLVGEFAMALEREGERLASLGELEGAIHCWGRLADVRPYESAVVLRLMRAMDAQGDRMGALERARRYAERRGRDLDAEPDRVVLGFAEELRSRAPAAPALPLVQPPFDRPGPVADSPERISLAANPKRRLRASHWLGLVAVVTVALVTTLLGRNPHPRADTGSIRIAIFPFAVVGDSEYRYLSEGMARLLSSNLDGGGQLITVSPGSVMSAVGTGDRWPDVERLRRIAGRLDADRFVIGTAIAKGDRLRLTAGVHSTTGNVAELREVAVEGPAAEFVSLVDSLTSELLVEEAHPADHLVRTAAATTHSIPALKEYLRGDHLFREGAYAAAAAAFDRATRLDPAFALAHYRCSLATLWADVPATSTAEHDAQALRYAERLAPRDRDLILAYLAWRRGDAVDADRRYHALWSRYPDDAEAGYQLAETMFHYGPLLGRPVEEASGTLREVLRIDPTHRGARWHLALLDGSAGRQADLLVGLEGLAGSPTADVEARGLLLRLQRKPLAADSALRAAAPGQLWSLGWRLAVHLRDFAGAEEAFRLIPRIDSAAQSQSLRDEGLLRIAQGRWDGGVEALWKAERYDRNPAVITLDGLVVNRLFTLRPAELTRLLETARRALATSDSASGVAPVMRTRLALAIGRLSLALHDSTGAMAAREALVGLGDTAATHSLDAFLSARTGRVDEALRHLDAARRTTWFGLAVVDPYFGQQTERFLRAELLLSQGKLEEALRWYGTFGEFALDDLPYLARAEQRRAEIYERLGQRAEAIRSLGRAVELWSDADPDRVPYALEVRRDLARLNSRGPS